MSLKTSADTAPVHSDREWATFGLLAITYGAFGLLTWYSALIPFWVLLPLGGFTACLHGSLCHEAVHGHPFRDSRANALLVAFSPIIWVPFLRYKMMHLAHHHDEYLTDPFDDPESWFLSPADYHSLTTPTRWLLRINNTVLGRLTIGPLIVFIRFVVSETKLIFSGRKDVITAWTWHLLAAAMVLYWAVGVCAMPVWEFLICFVWTGTSLTLLRSYAEHRAHEETAGRSVIVETNPLISLMFLNNNLHAVHHAEPQLAWYNIPNRYRTAREHFLEANKGYMVDGYSRLFQKYSFTPHQPVSHPLLKKYAKKNRLKPNLTHSRTG